MKKQIALSFLFFLLISFDASSQKLNYKVKVDGKESGTLEATKTGKKNNFQYYLKSKIKTSMLISIEVSYELKAIMQDGKLKSSSLVQFVNGIKQVNNHTEAKGTHYIFSDDSGNQKTISENILSIVPELYFTEPKNKSKIWSDNVGSFLKINSLGDGRYELITGENQSSIYNYSKGVCKKVETTQAYSRITFELIQ